MGLLKANEVAQILRVKTARVYELARIGLIPCIHMGRQVRFDEAALKEWMAGGGSVEKRQPPLPT